MSESHAPNSKAARRRDFLELLAISYACVFAMFVFSTIGGALVPYFGSTAMVVAKILGFVALCAWFCFFMVLNLRHAPSWFELSTTLRGIGWQFIFISQVAIALFGSLWGAGFLYA